MKNKQIVKICCLLKLLLDFIFAHVFNIFYCWTLSSYFNHIEDQSRYKLHKLLPISVTEAFVFFALEMVARVSWVKSTLFRGYFGGKFEKRLTFYFICFTIIRMNKSLEFGKRLKLLL